MKDELSNAIISGNIEFLKAYIDKGNDFNGITLTAPGGYGKSPIELAVLSQSNYKGSLEITKFIIDNSSDEKIAEVLFSFASEEKYLENMKVLLQCDVFVDLPHQNRTALQMATGNRNLKMTHLLLSHGANPKAEGEYGTALEEAEGISYEPAFEKMMLSFMKGEPKSPFDFIDHEKVIKQVSKWVYSLITFGKEQQNNTFYAVAIDGNKVVANSIEKFEITLKKYQEKYTDSYTAEGEIKKLKYSAGDFSFHEIEKEMDVTNSSGVDLDLTFLTPQTNDNRTKKDLLIEGLLKNKELFTKEMNVTDDFIIMADGHTY